MWKPIIQVVGLKYITMKKINFFFILFFCGVLSLSAQTRSEVQIGLAMPLGNLFGRGFASDNDNVFVGCGNAANGFFFGYKSLSQISLSRKGLYWTLSAGIMYNKLVSDYEDYEEQMMTSLSDITDVKFFKYLNFPVFAGLQFEPSSVDELKFFSEFGLGFNVLKITDYIYIYSKDLDNYRLVHSFDPSLKMAFKIGCGLLIRDKFTINMTYLGLGSHKGSHKVRYSYDENRVSEEREFIRPLSISCLNITFGVRF